MPFRRPAAVPDPAVRARLAALLGVAPDRTDPDPSPVVVPAGRFDLGTRGLAGLLVVGLLAVAVTGVVVWRGRVRPVPLDPRPPVAVASVPAPAALLVVDVAGDVRHPGLVRLPPGSRVADAIAAAGGVRPGATTGTLNLARKLVDGEQVYVGAPPGGAAPSGGGPSGLVNLNTATAEQLDALPGIGPVLADRIVGWREAHGGFASVEQLREVEGIGARKYDSIKALLTV